MLRVEFNDDRDGTLRVRLFGRMVGLYAEDARRALANRQPSASIVVDLSEVTFVDLFGEQMLLWLARLGAKFVANNVYARSVCEDLQLHISNKPAEDGSEREKGVQP